MFSKNSHEAMPRSAEIAESTLLRMQTMPETERGFAVLGMQCGAIQSKLSSANPAVNEWLRSPAGAEWRHMFSDFVTNMLLASADSPQQMLENKRNFTMGLSAFTQDVTGKKI